MSHTELDQPDLAALRAAAGDAEFAEAESRLRSTCGYPLDDADPLAPPACDHARSLMETGFTLHNCAMHEPLYRLGGVCLLPVSADPETGRSRTSVSWTTHDLLPRDHGRYGIYRSAHQAINAALGGVLRAFGSLVMRFGSGTGSRTWGTEAGR